LLRWFAEEGIGRERSSFYSREDVYSREDALASTRTEGVRQALLAHFQTFGLPDAFRSDNGSPFASKAPAGHSELSAW